MNEEQISRFWSKVQRADQDSCWRWQSTRTDDGYGTMSIGNRQKKAHRLSYIIEHGHIPDGLVIDHTCRNRLCVNPRHLRAVTRYVNVHENSECVAHLASLKTHCVNGHALEGDNLIMKDGRRQCRECSRAQARIRKMKIKQKQSLLGAKHESAVHEVEAPETPSPVTGERSGDEITRLSHVIERDRSIVSDCLARLNDAIAKRRWLAEPGKGSYAYDDDRWRDEFGEALKELEEAAQPLRKVADDWSDCPKDWSEIQTARAALRTPAGDAAGGVPESFVVAPREPTNDDVEKACAAYAGKGAWKHRREALDVTAEREAMRRALRVFAATSVSSLPGRGGR